MRLHDSPKAGQLTPSAIVKQLDKYIVGQPVGVLAGTIVRNNLQMQQAASLFVADFTAHKCSLPTKN
jgi:ATP-dependent protease HslVU (ClpYQ) ATPase subunit